MAYAPILDASSEASGEQFVRGATDTMERYDMRAIVTLASALALPAGFPERALVVVTAFFVTLGILSMQGLMLRTSLLLLDTLDGPSFDEQRRRARDELAAASLTMLACLPDEDADPLAPLLGAQHADAAAELKRRSAGQDLN